RGSVQIVVMLLDVFAVIPLCVAQAEQPLLQHRVSAVPQGERQAEPLLEIAEACQPVFAPAVGAAPRLVVIEVVPGVATSRVILANRSPLPLADVRSPKLPGRLALLVQSLVFSSHHLPCFLTSRRECS